MESSRISQKKGAAAAYRRKLRGGVHHMKPFHKPFWNFLSFSLSFLVMLLHLLSLSLSLSQHIPYTHSLTNSYCVLSTFQIIYTFLQKFSLIIVNSNSTLKLSLILLIIISVPHNNDKNIWYPQTNRWKTKFAMPRYKAKHKHFYNQMSINRHWCI